MTMMKFDLTDLLDEKACYEYLKALLHPGGLYCPRCGGQHYKILKRDREPIIVYQCLHNGCRRTFNIFTDTVFQGTHYSCKVLVQILKGIAQGTPTKHLAEELGIDRSHLTGLRHKLQDNALATRAAQKLADEGGEGDEMFPNAVEKRHTA